MKIGEILQLDYSLRSIKKIDTYLTLVDFLSSNYAKALAKLADILLKLGQDNLAFKIIFDYLDKTNGENDLIIYDALVDMYCYKEDYDTALQVINKKRTITDEKTYFLDLIKYYEIIDKKTSLIGAMQNYLSIEMDDDKRLVIIDKLANVYSQVKDKYNFIKWITTYKTLAMKNDMMEEYFQASIKEAICYYENKEYDNLLSIVTELKNRKMNDTLRGSLLMLELALMVYKDADYRGASIFEANNEANVDISDLYTRKEFCKICIHLYEQMGNQFNLNVYNNKLSYLNTFNEELHKEEETIVPLTYFDYKFMFLEGKKEEVKEVVVEEKENVEVKQEPKEEIKEAKEEIRKFEISKKQDSYINITKMFENMNNQRVTKHEYYRQFFTNMSQIVRFSECFIMIGDEQYHYKKERLYSKHLNLANTIILEAFNRLEEIYCEDLHELDYKTLFSDKLYNELEERYVLYCVPTYSYSVLFKFDKTLDAFRKQEIKLCLSYLELHLQYEKELALLHSKFDKYEKMFEVNFIGFKTMKDQYLSLSSSLAKKIEVNSELLLSEYLAKVDNKDVSEYYKYLKNSDFSKPLIYKFKKQNIYVKEYFLSYDDTIFSVLAMCNDELAREDKTKVDNYTGLYNKTYLEEVLKLADEKDTKYSLALLKTMNLEYYNEVYGFDFVYQINKAIALKLKQYDHYKIKCFLIESCEYVLLFEDIVDKRTLKNILEEIYSFLKDELNKFNSRLSHLDFKLSYLKYSDIDKLKLSEVLKMLYYSFTEEVVSSYEKDNYKKKMFEQSLVTHISESIDENMLLIDYVQAVNYKEKSIKYLFVSPNLSDFMVEQEKMDLVIEKRKLKNIIEKYMLHRGLFELNEIREEKKYFLPFVFSLSYESVVDEAMLLYIKEQAKFFNIPMDVINIYYHDKVDKLVINNLLMMANAKINIIVDDLNILNFVKIKAFIYHNNDNKSYFIDAMNKYFLDNEITLIIDNVDKESEVSYYAEKGINYYKGKLYSKILTYKDLIKN